MRPAQFLNGAVQHIHADATSRKIGDCLSGRETRLKNHFHRALSSGCSSGRPSRARRARQEIPSRSRRARHRQCIWMSPRRRRPERISPLGGLAVRLAVIGRLEARSAELRTIWTSGSYKRSATTLSIAVFLTLEDKIDLLSRSRAPVHAPFGACGGSVADERVVVSAAVLQPRAPRA